AAWGSPDAIPTVARPRNQHPASALPSRPVAALALARAIRILVLAAGLVPRGAAAGAHHGGAAAGYPAVYDEFTGPAPDSSRVAHVERLELRRDVGLLVLGPGTFVECRPVRGQRCAVVYRGAGSFRYDPPDAIERQQLERFFGAAPLERRLDGVVLMF